MWIEKILFCAFLFFPISINCSLRGRKCYIEYSVGTCTLLTECKPLVKEILKAGEPMPYHMKQKLKQLTCDFSQTQPLVCCVPEDDTETQSRSLSNTQGTHILFNSTESDAPEARIPDIRNHPNLGLLPTKCGVSVTDDRIVGGTTAALFEMPWMVLLSYASVRGSELDCGGTLINERYVLTAAHCVAFLPHGLVLKNVILGEYDLYQDPDCESDHGQQICAPRIKTVPVAEATAHSGYSKESLMDDIAIIRLSEPADFTLDSVKPICLPVTPELQKENLVGKNCVVAGWGITESGAKSSVLMKVYVPVVSKKQCQESYKGEAVIYDQQLCAGGVKGKDSCGGDSGGPLIFPGRLGPGPVKSVQRGIVSFGTEECGIAGIPGVYTNVAYYMDWILDHMHR